MKVKLHNLVDPRTATDIHPAISRFADVDLPVKAGFRLKGVIKEIVAHFQTYLDTRLDLYKKYGDHDEKNDTYEVPKDKVAEFQADFQQLLDTDVTLTGDRFKLADFYSHSAIRANDLLALEWLIDDGTPVISETAKKAADHIEGFLEELDEKAQDDNSPVADLLDLNEKSDVATA